MLKQLVSTGPPVVGMKHLLAAPQPVPTEAILSLDGLISFSVGAIQILLGCSAFRINVAAS